MASGRVDAFLRDEQRDGMIAGNGVGGGDTSR